MPDGRFLTLSHDVGLHDAVDGLFLDRALARGLPELGLDGWPVAEASLAALGPTALRFAAEGMESALYEWDDALVAAGRHGAHVHVSVAAADRDRLETTLARLRELLPSPDPSTKHEVTVTFWTYTPHGPQPSWRTIGVPEWNEIRDNYASATREGLEEIMRGFRPAHGGQLVLWHGEAGTGKTFALRALAWEWREWCELHYIVDPDSFFGEHADYLMSVLLQEGAPIPRVHHFGGWASTSQIVAVKAEDGEAEERAWRVLVLEDTGELLSAEARASAGQGLSRFLNVVDGLIGQGLRVLVLVTTNEPIRSLHPAVARPGRAAANIRFVPLDEAEAQAWLERRGMEPVAGTATLAALYARAEGRDPGAATLASFGD